MVQLIVWQDVPESHYIFVFYRHVLDQLTELLRGVRGGVAKVWQDNLCVLHWAKFIDHPLFH